MNYDIGKMVAETFIRGVIVVAVALAACSRGQATSARPEQPQRPRSGRDLAPPWIVDDKVTIRSESEVTARRRALVAFLWGAAGFPDRALPAEVKRGVASPLTTVTPPNLARVDDLVIEMEAGEKTVAHHFIARRSNHRVVILHQGHDCTFDDNGTSDDGGMARAIDGLLTAGYSVLAVYMPHMMPGDCGTQSHAKLLQLPVTAGHPLKFFLEPVAVSLNYLRSRASGDAFPRYDRVSLIGLSGGGWTTVLYAALDPTVPIGIDVAGSMPLFLRSFGSEGDPEQFVRELYAIAGYPDLYVLGAHGRGRKLVQILNRRDDCCFGEGEHASSRLGGLSWQDGVRGYERLVQRGLETLAAGAYRIYIDETATRHEISRHARTVCRVGEPSPRSPR